MIYAINYDLCKPGSNYEGLSKAIKGCGSWWHHLGSTWLVDTHLNATDIFSRLSSNLDSNDKMLIIGVTDDYNGWLPQEAWDWIRSCNRRVA